MFGKTRQRARVLGVAAGLTLLAGAPTAGAQVTQWDQRNDGPLGMYSYRLAAVPFTPTAAALDTVQMCMSGDAATVSVDIIGPGGATLGSSSVESTAPGIPNDPFLLNYTTLTFEFDAPVALTPGAEHTIQVVGHDGHAFAAETLDPNNLMGSAGVWFREGLGVDATALDPANAASYLGLPTCPPGLPA